jgi:hypothetical protein
MDYVLQQLQSKPPGYEDSPAPQAAAKAAKAAAKPLSEGLGDGLTSAGKDLGDAGAAASKGLTNAADSVGDVFGGASKALGGAASGAADSVSGALGGASKALGGAASGAAESVTGVLGGAADSVNGALGGAGKALGSAAEAAAASKAAAAAAAAEAVGGTVGAAQGFVEAAAAEFNTEIGIIQDNIDSLVGGAQAAVGGAVSGAVDQVAGLLPPEVQSALGAGAWAWAAPACCCLTVCLLALCLCCEYHSYQLMLMPLLYLFLPLGAVASTAVGAAREVVALTGSTDNTTVAVTAGLGLGLPALAAWRAAYGGFAGVLPPAEALKLLQSGGDVVLLDVRTEAVRNERGVVELKRGALGKGAAVPPVQVGPPACPARVVGVVFVAAQLPVALSCSCHICAAKLAGQLPSPTHPAPRPHHPASAVAAPSLCCRSCCPAWRGGCATPLPWLWRFRRSRLRRCPRSGLAPLRLLSSTHRFVPSWWLAG